MSKRIISLLLAVSMVFCMMANAVVAVAQPVYGLSISKTSLKAGDTFTVTLKIEDSNGTMVTGSDSKVLFDKNVFEVTEYTAPVIEGFQKTQSSVEASNKNGFFSASYNTASGEADAVWPGATLVCTFKVKETGPKIVAEEVITDYSFEIEEYCAYDEEGNDIFEGKTNYTKNVDVEVNIPATRITLNKESISIAMGETETLVATVEPENATETVEWSSDDDTVAIVDQTGKVTPVSEGTATITATVGSFSDSCEVTVTKKSAGLTVKDENEGDVEEVDIDVDETASFLASNTAKLEITVESDDPTVATVEEDQNTAGKYIITGKKEGSAKITVSVAGDDTYEADSKEITVNVSKIPLEIEVTSTINLRVKGEAQVVASIKDAPVDAPELIYSIESSTDQNITMVNDEVFAGEVAATARIAVDIASSDKYTAETAYVDVTVSLKDPQTITVTDYDEGNKYVVAGTYGEGTIGISATTDNTEDGAGITYTYKEVQSVDDYFTINETTGEITDITKAGPNAKATVIITAAETENYAETTKEVVVLIHKGEQDAVNFRIDTAATTSDSITALGEDGRVLDDYVLEYAITDVNIGPTPVEDGKITDEDFKYVENNEGKCVFTDLDPNTTYYIVARKQETDVLKASPASNVDSERTKKLEQTITVTTPVNVRIGGELDLSTKASTDAEGNTLSFKLLDGGSFPAGTSMTNGVITAGTTTGTFVVVVSAGENDYYYAADDKEITVNVVVKDTQTITASDVTATYGDTDKAVSATTNNTETGAEISYAVKADGKSPSIIEVNSETGALTFKKAGTAYVVVTASETDNYAEETKEVKVTVAKKELEIKGVPETLFVRTGNTKTIEATITNDQTLAFASDTPANATVDAEGVVTGVKAGSATVTVSLPENDCYEAEPVTCAVTVEDKLEQTIIANDVNVTYGDTNKKVAASVNTTAKNEGAEISYAVTSGTDVIDIDATTGAITIKKAGTAKVTVTSTETENYAETTKEVTVTVAKKELVIKGVPETLFVRTGNTKTINATITNEQTLAFTSDTPANATVDAEGVVTGVKAGTATVTVSLPVNDYYTAESKEVAVTVEDKIGGTINANNVNVIYGDTNKKVVASVITAAAKEGAEITKYEVTDGTDVIDIDEATGAITIKKVGTAKVTITASGTENYAETTKEVTVTVATRVVKIQWNDYKATRAYDGNASNITATVANKVDADDVSLTVTGGTETNAGTYTAEAALAGTAKDNYELPAVHSVNYTITRVTPEAPSFPKDVKEKTPLGDVDVKYDDEHYDFIWEDGDRASVEKGKSYKWKLKAKEDFEENYSDREGSVTLIRKPNNDNPVIVIGEKETKEYNPNTGADSAISLAALAAVFGGAFILIGKKH